MEIESDLTRIRTENQKLKEELKQTLADKEFVWGLWKRLQTTSPDMAQAISLVMKREKEKSEEKDKKVLQVFQAKDTKLEELQQIVTKQSKELSSVIQQKSDLLDTVKRLEVDVINLSDRSRTLEKQLNERDGHQREEHHHAIQKYEREKLELTERITLLQTDLAKTKSECGDLLAGRVMLDNRIKMLEAELEKFQNASKSEAALHERILDLERELSLSHANESSLISRVRELEDTCEEQDLLIDELRDRQTNLWNRQADKPPEPLVSRVRNGPYHGPVPSSHLDQMNNSSRKARSRSLPRGGPGKSSLDDSFIPFMSKNSGRSKRRRSRRLCEEVFPDMSSDEREFDYLETKSDSELARSDDEDDSAYFDEDEKARVMTPVVDLDYKVDRLENQINLLTECLKSKTAKNQPSHTIKDKISLSRNNFTIEALKKKVSMLQQKLSRAENSLKDKSHELEEMTKSWSKANDRLKSLQITNRTLKDGLNEKNAELEQWRYDLEDKDREYERKSAELDAEYKRNLEMKKEISSLQDQHRFDTNKLQEYIITLDETREKYHRDINEYNKAVATDERVRHLQSQLNESLIKIDHYELELTRLRKEIFQFDAFKSAFESEKNGLKSELQITVEELSQKRLEVTTLQKALISNGHSVPPISFLRRNQTSTRKGRTLTSASRLTKPSVAQKGGFLKRLVDEDNPQDSQWEDVDDEEEDVSVKNFMESDRTQSSLGSRIVHVACNNNATRRLSHKSLFRSASLPRNRIKLDDLDQIPIRESDTRDYFDGSVSGDVALAASVMRVSPTIILKRRVACLQQQLLALRKFRSQAGASIKSLQEKNKKLQHELNQSNFRSKRLKDTIEILNSELTTLHEERGTSSDLFYSQYKDLEFSKNNNDDLDHRKKSLRSESAPSKTTVPCEQSAELMRQGSIIRSLRSELESKEEKLKDIKERLSRSERDVASKRHLLEELRARLKANQAVTQEEKESVTEQQDRIISFKDVIDRQKVQIDSLKTRLNTAMEERRRYEAELHQARQECDKRDRQLADARIKRCDLERTVNDLEKSQRERIMDLTYKSSNALDEAAEKLSRAQSRLNEFEQFLSYLCRLMERHREEVSQFSSTGNRRAAPSKWDGIRQELTGERNGTNYDKARNRAATLLNLSRSDLDDFMRDSKRYPSDLSLSDDFEQNALDLLKKKNFGSELRSLFDSKLRDIMRIVHQIRQ